MKNIFIVCLIFTKLFSKPDFIVEDLEETGYYSRKCRNYSTDEQKKDRGAYV